MSGRENLQDNVIINSHIMESE